ncbi:mandelate racemase/muconate lactonizing enzyme family protein [Pseudenhygromyxa sp. WMMC2535]|uniref:mandelate racemase/muconate lactonizing enzyme family protein n=1 Tax=Pseudenhygromyxa sp. WMMC2535 TaxID=2712867 RepID=UPI001552AF45|nr:mandelate racemase/muconate lactonizing enzyme family protein [Pseudenhygromyxa sp. WMMC2535]NVB42925.1 mandelate racemase/muconate lactonizing enzyme family protein [Pseudenhygromyxa sp. WMMC2535]
MSTRIESIEAIPVRLPTRATVRFANGSVDAAEHVIVRVNAEDGHQGIAEASPRPMTYGDSSPGVVHALTQLIAPRVVGLDSCSIEGVHAALTDLVGNVTARAALDVALWDLLGKRAGLPVSTLLGGYSPKVRVAHLLSLDTPEKMAEEAVEVQAQMGVQAFKIKVGLDPAGDVDRAVAVREAVGAGALLYVDANHKWSAEAALPAVRAMQARGVNLAWVEEPSPANQVLGRQWLAQHLDLPVVADESAPDVHAAASQLTSQRCRWIALKAGRVGFRGGRDIVGLAAGLGAELVVGSQIEGALGAVANLHLAAAFAATSRYPAELNSGRSFADDVITPPAIVDGWMHVPDAPGLGVTLDAQALDRLRVD